MLKFTTTRGALLKWFKHDCQALKDEKIQFIISECGISAYIIFFGLCELCGEKIDKNLDPSIKIDWHYAEKLFHSKRSTIRKVMTCCAVANLLLWEANDKLLICSVPNLLKRLDNWTRDLVVASKKLPSIDQEPEVKNKNQKVNPELKDEKDGFLSEEQKQIVLKDIAVTNHVGAGSEAAKLRLENIVAEISKVKDVKNALALARHKALRQK